MELQKGKIYNFTVDELILEKKAIILKDDYEQKHYFPRLLDLGSFIKLKVCAIDQYGKYHFKELQDYSFYNKNQVYKFDVISKFNIKSSDKVYFSLFDKTTDVSSVVRAYPNQLTPNEIPKFVFCKVIDIDQENNELILNQVTSPQDNIIYKDGEFYEFTYIGPNEDDTNFINVKGIDGKVLSLNKPLNTSKTDLKINTPIKYVCQMVNMKLRFRSFVTFDDIIKYRILKQNTFDSFKNSESPLAMKLYEDFDKKNNLWILSFCKVLEDEYKKSINKDEYEKALMYGEVLVEIENWIINSGFLQSFKSHIEEKEKYAIGSYNKFIIYTKALDIILSNNTFQYINNLCLEISSISNIDSIIHEKIRIIRSLLILLKDQIKTSGGLESYTYLLQILGQKDCFKIRKLEIEFKSITLHIKEIISNFEKTHLSKLFLNLSSVNEYYNNNEHLRLYLKMLRIYILILNDFNLTKELNLHILKYIRIFSLYTTENTKQKLYIESALKFSNTDFEDTKIKELLTWENTDIITQILYYIQQIPQKRINKIETIKKALENKEVLVGEVKSEDRYGYIVNLLGNKSILPTNWIAAESELNLKINPERKIPVSINRIDEEFARIIISNNLKLYDITEEQNIEVGSIVEGIVKCFETYGTFIDLGFMDGLLPLYEMSYCRISHPSELLKIGEVIKLKVIENKIVDNKTQVTLSIKDLRKSSSNLANYDTIYNARITRLNNKYICIEVLETGESGIIYKDQISRNKDLEIEDFYTIGEKINVKLINKKDKGSIFSIKEANLDPYIKIDPNKYFLGSVYEIKEDQIIIKSNTLGQFVYCKCNEDSENISLEVHDNLKFRIVKVIKTKNIIFVEIDYSSINKNNIEYSNDKIDKKINDEIGKCYELYAMQKEDLDSKNNYLNWAKIFYSLSNSAKSYYLNFYIRYQDIIRSSHINIYTDYNIDNLIIGVIDKSKMLIKEIESKELATSTFPLLEQLKITLEILCSFDNNSKKTTEYLFDIIKDNNICQAANYQLAKIVLSYNLFSSEIKNNNLKKEHWTIIHNILEEGLLNIESLPIIDEKTNSLLEIIKQDESRTLEFKSSLMTPIPDKSKRSLIRNLETELKIALENNNKEREEKLKFKIEELNNNNAKKAVIHSAMKTLVAFANSEGGSLIIGLEDDKNILGLCFDFLTLGEKKENVFDAFNLAFDTLINEYIGTDFNLLFESKTEFIKIDEKYLYFVKIKKSKYPIYLKKDEKGNQVSEVWIRAQGSSNKINKAEELQKFFKQFE